MNLNQDDLDKLFLFFKDFERGVESGKIVIEDEEYKQEFLRDAERYLKKLP